MATNVLLIAPEAAEYEEYLVPRFQGTDITFLTDVGAAGPHIADAEIFIIYGRGYPKKMFDDAKNLKWIQCFISGIDHFDDLLADRDDLWLTSGRGIHGPQMSEHAFFHMLGVYRQARRVTKAQENHQWDPFTPKVLNNRAVGILGMGIIAEALAARCKAFGMTVLGISKTVRDIPNVDKVFARADLLEAVAGVDFLVALTPYEPDTHHIVSTDVFKAMKPSAHLINISRGGVVDEPAMIAALRAGDIAGAGLDVFDNEPLESESPLWDMDNVFITTWFGGRSDQYAQQILTVIEPNLRTYLDGDLENLTNIIRRPATADAA